MTGHCKLCGANSPLILSHIIPKFVVKWFKKTSATGYFRSFKTGKRVQEIHRLYLLCADCEQRLGRDEKRFAERIFVPYLTSPQPKSFDYDEWLLKFLVGLHWRILVAHQHPFPDNVREIFAGAEERWRKYLLEQAPDPGTSEFHVQFTDVIDRSTFKVPDKMNWYLARSTDGTPIHNKSGDAGVFVKFPRLITLSFVTPRDPEKEDWRGTQIMARGTINVKQEITTTYVGEFLLGRARMIDVAPEMMTQRQKRKVFDDARKNPEKILDSDSFRVHQADRNMRITQSVPVTIVLKGRDRNKPCPCGSGFKAKKCCGKWM